MNTSQNLRMTVYASLFAALISVGAYLSIPIGPVPIVLQNMFVYLAGLLLGSRWGLASVGVYLLAGACGLPVFAGGLGGIGRIVGPTGGYLIGFVAMAFIVGWLTERGWDRKVWTSILAMLTGSIAMYIFGLLWLMQYVPEGTALQIGLYPFIVGDIVKIVVAALLLPSGWLLLRHFRGK